jgi:hypothetical protein
MRLTRTISISRDQEIALHLNFLFVKGETFAQVNSGEFPKQNEVRANSHMRGIDPGNLKRSSAELRRFTMRRYTLRRASIPRWMEKSLSKTISRHPATARLFEAQPVPQLDSTGLCGRGSVARRAW